MFSERTGTFVSTEKVSVQLYEISEQKLELLSFFQYISTPYVSYCNSILVSNRPMSVDFPMNVYFDFSCRLRAKYGTSERQNALHGSESFHAAAREIKFMFPNSKMDARPFAYTHSLFL